MRYVRLGRALAELVAEDSIRHVGEPPSTTTQGA
jgi:hypothetical protein